jgi:hypothetical protein
MMVNYLHWSRRILPRFLDTLNPLDPDLSLDARFPSTTADRLSDRSRTPELCFFLFNNLVLAAATFPLISLFSSFFAYVTRNFLLIDAEGLSFNNTALSMASRF